MANKGYLALRVPLELYINKYCYVVAKKPGHNNTQKPYSTPQNCFAGPVAWPHCCWLHRFVNARLRVWPWEGLFTDKYRDIYVEKPGSSFSNYANFWSSPRSQPASSTRNLCPCKAVLQRVGVEPAARFLTIYCQQWASMHSDKPVSLSIPAHVKKKISFVPWIRVAGGVRPMTLLW